MKTARKIKLTIQYNGTAYHGWAVQPGLPTVQGTLEEAFEKLFRLDDWNDVVIIAKGNRIQHYLNGRLILDFTDEDPQSALSEGVLALQLHAGKPMWAEYKDVRVKAIE